MQAMPIRIYLILLIIFIISPSALQAATEKRIALVIGNSAYSSGPLKNPVNDATAMDAKLKKLGFTVTLKRNAKLQEMDESIREFGRQLKRTRGVGLFFYAGHGMQIGGVNYLLPVDAKIEKESDVRFQSVNADMVLAEMENAENGLNLVILDACRDNPYSRSFRNATRGLAIVSNAPAGTFISYSTGANQVARDGEGKNSPYTRVLLEYIDKPGLSINNVFMNVRSKVKKETGQIPWELSSLESDFYFNPNSQTILKSGSTHISSIKNEKLEDGTTREPNKNQSDSRDIIKGIRIPLDKAIKIGNGKGIIIEFTDPDCVYCRRAAEFLDNLNDISRYIFFYPITKIHPQSKDKVMHILCADDMAKAYHDAMSGKLDKKEFKVCTDTDAEMLLKIHENIALQFKIAGTPLFYVNGGEVMGFDKDKIEHLLVEPPN